MLSDNNIVSLGIASGDPRLHEMEAARQAEEDARAAEDQERREVYAVMLRAGMKHIESEMKAKLRQAKEYLPGEHTAWLKAMYALVAPIYAEWRLLDPSGAERERCRSNVLLTDAFCALQDKRRALLAERGPEAFVPGGLLGSPDNWPPDGATWEDWMNARGRLTHEPPDTQ